MVEGLKGDFIGVQLLQLFSLFSDSFRQSIPAIPGIPEQGIAGFSVSSGNDAEFIGLWVTRNANGMFAMSQFFVRKSGGECSVVRSPSIPAIGSLMGNEFEAESLARAGEGVEILDKDIHLGDVAHRGSFTTEQIIDGGVYRVAL